MREKFDFHLTRARPQQSIQRNAPGSRGMRSLPCSCTTNIAELKRYLHSDFKVKHLLFPRHVTHRLECKPKTCCFLMTDKIFLWTSFTLFCSSKSSTILMCRRTSPGRGDKVGSGNSHIRSKKTKYYGPMQELQFSGNNIL